MTSSFDVGVRAGMVKTAVDPMTIGAVTFGAKQLAANALARHAMKIPGAKRVAQEVVGFGARAGAAGRPMPHRVFREAAALAGSPALVSAFEHAHAAGKAMGPSTSHNLQAIATHPLLARLAPGVEKAQDFIAGVPMESKGLRAVADYGMKPLREVGADISAKGREMYNRMALKRGLALKPEPVK